MRLALLVNLTAFPVTNGLLPSTARDIYDTNQTGFGTLVASFALGSLRGSIGVSLAGRAIRAGAHDAGLCPGLVCLAAGFAPMPNATGGRVMLILAGIAQSLSLTPMSVMLPHSAGERFRGRVMGVRTLAIYGVPIGLLAAWISSRGPALKPVPGLSRGQLIRSN